MLGYQFNKQIVLSLRNPNLFTKLVGFVLSVDPYNIILTARPDMQTWIATSNNSVILSKYHLKAQIVSS